MHRFLLIAGALLFSLGFSGISMADTSHRIDVLPPDGTQSATPVLRAAIRDAIGASQGGSLDRVEVVLAAGNYYLDADPSDDHAILRADGGRNVIVRGSGPETRLIVRDNTFNAGHFTRKVISINGTQQFTLQDLEIDFAPDARDWLQGVVRRVTKNADDTVTFDFDLDDASPPFRENAFATPTSFCMGVVLNEHDQPRDDFPDFISVQSIVAGDAHLRVTASVWEGVDPVAHMEGQRTVLLRRKPGEALFSLSGNNVHPTLRNIVIRGSRGMMIEAYGCDRLELDGFRMQAAPGQWLISPGDGLHYQGCVSGPYVHNSHFERLADDAIHLYSKPFPVKAMEKAIYIEKPDFYMAPDHRIWVYPSHAPGEGRLFTVAELKDDHATLNGDWPADWVPDRAINLDRSGAGFEVSNNTFGPMRGIGLRIQTGNGIIANNVFTRVGSAAISFESGLGEHYDEGPFAYNVKVEGNRFIHTGSVAGYGWVAVRKNVRWNPYAPHHTLAFRNLELKDNHAEGGTTVPDSLW